MCFFPQVLCSNAHEKSEYIYFELKKNSRQIRIQADSSSGIFARCQTFMITALVVKEMEITDYDTLESKREHMQFAK